MKMLKRLNAIVLLLVMAVAVGCGGSDDPEPDNPGQNNNKCLITKKFSKNSNGQKLLITEFFYDNNRRLVRQNFTFGHYVVYHYDATGLIITTKEYNQDDSLMRYDIYEHNSNGSLVSYKFYSRPNIDDPITHQATLTQEFNQSKLITRANYFNNPNLTWPTNYSIYSHLPNNVVKEEMYNNLNNVPELYTTTIKQFDNNNVPTIFNFYNDGFGNHNVLSSIVNWPGTTNKNEAFYKYKYNSDNFPTEVTRMRSDSTVVETIYYEYSCI